MKYWLTIALKNILNRPLSSFLTILLLSLGIAISAFLMILDKQMNDNFEKNLAGIDLIIGAKGSPLQTVLCNLYHIDVPTGNINIDQIKAFLNPKHPLIKQSIPLLLGDSYNTYRIVGTTYAFLDNYKASFQEGRKWQAPFETVVGYDIAKRLNLKIGASFKSSHGLIPSDDEHDIHYTITGILKKSGSVLDQLVLTSPQSVWSSHHSEADDHDVHESTDSHQQSEIPNKIDTCASDLIQHTGKEITSVLILFKNKNFQTLNMARSINENTDVMASNPAIELNRLYDTMGIGEKILRYLVVILLLVGGVSIFIALLQAMKDRKYELAIMRVMGSSSGKLALLALLESLMICAGGLILGLIIAHTGVWVFGGYAAEKYKYSFDGLIWINEESKLCILVAIIGILAGLFPAISAYRTEISKTLTQS